MKKFLTARVRVSRAGRGAWVLRYVDPCPACGGHHTHGGGKDPEPDLGTRIRDCPSEHASFRPDCELVVTYGRAKCFIRHDEPLMVNLVMNEEDDL